ncbi:MAG: hypothetical protein ACLSVD_16040 [Eggerthellaceae bacterium]
MALLLLGIGLLVFTMAQMQSYASIINDAGVVRGGTQRASSSRWPASRTTMPSNVWTRSSHR